jgi:hypothetical protein
MSRLKITTSLLAVAAVLSLSEPSDAVTFSLFSDDCPSGCGTGPYGTVDITQAGANVSFIVDLSDNPLNIISWAQTGITDFQLFKFNAFGVTIGDISVAQTFSGQTLQANTGSFNADGTGPFSFAIGCSTCGNGNLGITSEIAFTIANATISDVTAGNPLNIFVAGIHSSQTGFIGPVSTTVAVPGPLAGAGIPGLIAGCLGLWGLMKRRRRLVSQHA